MAGTQSRSFFPLALAMRHTHVSLPCCVSEFPQISALFSFLPTIIKSLGAGVILGEASCPER